MNLKQFRNSSGNLSYIIYGKKQALVIDGVTPNEILTFIEDMHLSLRFITNTHMHADHTSGNGKLSRKTEGEFRSIESCVKDGFLTLEDEELRVFPTPGHSLDSIVFTFDNNLITGDTLFNGTVGNCYTSDYETYFSSLKRLLDFPAETNIYAGHDLVDYALGVAKDLEPENPYIDPYLDKYDPNHVVSTLQDELRINPFIRFNDPALDRVREKTGMPLETEYQRWRALMTIH